MAVLLNNDAVFLHVPKTGGSWVTEVLESSGFVRRQFSHIHADHARAENYLAAPKIFATSVVERIKSRVPNSLKAKLWPLSAREAQVAKNGFHPPEGPFYFCFVRHPLAWYESWWRYMCGRSGGDWTRATDLVRWHPCAALRELGDGDFNQFVRNMIAQQPGFVTQLYGRFTAAPNTFVGRQEHLVEDLLSVLRKMNFDVDESVIRQRERVNVSQSDEVAWDPELKAEVKRLEYAGLVRHGYETCSTEY